MKDQLKELFKSVDPSILTEDVSTKLETLFETAVEAKVATLKEEIEAKLTEEARNELAQFKEKLVNTLNDFSQMTADTYLTENVDELESTMKVQALQKLVTGIGRLFKEEGLLLPIGEKSLAEELEKKNSELKEDVNSLVEEKLNLQEELLRQIGLRVWSEETKDLPLDRQEDLKKLMEEVEFVDEDSLRNKIQIMSESFLNSKVDDEGGKKKVLIKESDTDASKFASGFAKNLV